MNTLPTPHHDMSDSLGRRIFLAHLELSYRLGRKVTLAEFGQLIARRMARDTPFTAAAVSRWESGSQIPIPQIIEAIGAITHTDPGWISHGRKSAAPRPHRVESTSPAVAQPVDVEPGVAAQATVVPGARKTSPPRRRA